MRLPRSVAFAAGASLEIDQVIGFRLANWSRAVRGFDGGFCQELILRCQRRGSHLRASDGNSRCPTPRARLHGGSCRLISDIRRLAKQTLTHDYRPPESAETGDL
jgi:hypothetical protein